MGIKETFAVNIKAIRKVRGLSQGELAKACGFSRVYMAKIEGGQCWASSENVDAICLALRCDPSDLVSKPENQIEKAMRVISDALKSKI